MTIKEEADGRSLLAYCLLRNARLTPALSCCTGKARGCRRWSARIALLGVHERMQADGEAVHEMAPALPQEVPSWPAHIWHAALSKKQLVALGQACQGRSSLLFEGKGLQ